MRSASIILLCLLSVPAAAGCRLSPADCSVVMKEMEAEAEAGAGDERKFHPRDLSRYDRGVALSQRHIDRVDQRSFVLPTRIADEWLRLELCADPKGADTSGCR